jgi:hypothetical protein
MRSWCSAASAYELDAGLVRALREVKSILSTSFTAYHERVSQLLAERIKLEAVPAGPLRGVLKQLLELSYGLSNTKELRELFGTLEHLAESQRVDVGLSAVEADVLFECVVEGCASMAGAADPAALGGSWERFIEGLRPIVVLMVERGLDG